MLEIVFEDEQDKAAFLHLMQLSDHRDKVVVNEGVKRIRMKKVQDVFNMQQYIKPIVAKFFLRCKEDEYMLSLLEKTYLFLDQDEQQQILQLAHSIMDGEIEEIPWKKKGIERERYILQELETICLEESVFAIRSFMTFRLGKYYQYLKECVEAAIDEYKMEQEYQSFIQSLREYVTINEPKMKKVHIVHDGHFILWELKQIQEREQKKYIDRRFVREHPLYIDSQLLAPLISIAPAQIELYTNEHEHAMVQTIQNIFEEKVKIYALSSFNDQHIL